MQKIIECVPNFSEGRDLKKIEKMVQAITSISGITLLDQESDPAHNRSVVTFVGDSKAVFQAAFAGIKKASELIDMDIHKGEHPRMGATDVCPFIPISGVTIEECIDLAKKLAKKVGEQLKIPVYLYEKAAIRPQRENLANIRQGEYEIIKKEIGKNSERDPDFGPKKLGKAGATAIGVREILVAYNVNLDTNDLKIAKAIAKKIRFKDGGFPFVKALGFMLKDRGIVQVSMNLTNYKETAVYKVFQAIKKEAKTHGVKVLESEVIGLIPEKALIEAAKYFLKIKNFKDEQILEKILALKMEKSEMSLENFLDQVASKSPVPGGGSVSALAGSLAAALGSMVANLTLNSKRYKKVHKNIIKELPKTEKLRAELFELIEADSLAYQKVRDVYKNSDQKNIQQALKQAALSPLKIAATAIKILEPLEVLIKNGNQNAISDCGVAIYLIEAAIKGAILNIKINMKYIEDKQFNKVMIEKIKKFKKIIQEKSKMTIKLFKEF